MSYCRFSTDDFNCDLYAYESDAEFVIRVAASRHVGDCPSVDWDGFMASRVNEQTIVDQQNAQIAWLRTCTREPIAIAGAGESFYEPDLAAFKARLLDLRSLGFRFPDEVLATVDEEIAEQFISAGA